MLFAFFGLGEQELLILFVIGLFVMPVFLGALLALVAIVARQMSLDENRRPK